MSPRLTEYLVSTNSVPIRPPLASRTMPGRPRRLRMAQWVQRIQPQ